MTAEFFTAKTSAENNIQARRSPGALAIGRAALSLAAASILLLTGCGTVAPKENLPASASWDGSTQNSGLLADVGSSMTVTAHWRDRYNALIGVYGAQFKPALTKDEGIAPGAPGGGFYANHFARIHFFEMNVWDHSAMHLPTAPMEKAGPR